MTSIVCGPSGGFGGQEFLDVVPSRSTPEEIRVSATTDTGLALGEASIAAVQFLYVTVDGAVIEQPHHGIHSNDAGAQHTIPLGEQTHVTRLAGRYGKYVDSIEITTVREVEGANPQVETKRFGTSAGAANFVYEAPPGFEIVGFCGRSFDFLDAIGVVFRPLAERGVATGEDAEILRAVEERRAGGGSGGNLPTNEPPQEEPEPMERSGGPIKPR